MATKKHLALLRRGVQGWNEWRHGNDSIEPDLSEADLRRADLREADLRRADLRRAGLREADLRRADLMGAILTGAILTGATLTGATLTEATLRRADLRRAYLTGAILTEADLTGADLRRADLMGAILTGATLTGATLTGADLTGATLTGADLTGATLTGTYLTEADLTEADLTGADLRRATLTEATLTRTTLTGTKFYETTLGDTALTHTRGLDSCQHEGPSTIDHRTIMRSWPLPLSFLRGCGLSDTLIDYLPSLLNKPLEFSSCFISYSSSDQPFAERVHADLQNKGVRCWFAPKDMKIGDEFRSRIDRSIHLYERLLLIFSEHSVKSRWVQKEVETAFEKEGKENRLVLFPIRVDEAVMDSTVGWAADIRRSRHIGNFTKWKDHDAYQQAFTRLLRDLKAEATEEQRKST